MKRFGIVLEVVLIIAAVVVGLWIGFNEAEHSFTRGWNVGKKYGSGEVQQALQDVETQLWRCQVSLDGTEKMERRFGK